MNTMLELDVNAALNRLTVAMNAELIFWNIPLQVQGTFRDQTVREVAWRYYDAFSVPLAKALCQAEVLVRILTKQPGVKYVKEHNPLKFYVLSPQDLERHIARRLKLLQQALDAWAARRTPMQSLHTVPWDEMPRNI